MAGIIWSREALARLALIFEYIAEFDPNASARIVDRLLAAGESLNDLPNRGRPAMDGTRELVTVPPYILRYEVLGDTMRIVAIRHGAQHPRDPA